MKRIVFMLIPNIKGSFSLALLIQSYKPEKNSLIFEEEDFTPKKSRNLDENCTLSFSLSGNLTVEVSISYRQKCGIFYFCQKKDYGCVFSLFIFFFQGVIISN